MKEFVFVMKKGTEVPPQFDGATVPIQAPGSNAEMIAEAGDKAYIIYNRARVLDTQKAIKVESQKEGATLDGLRKFAADYKVGEVRTRTGTGTGKPRTSAKAVAAVLGDDFIASLTPEQRKKYDDKMAQLASARQAKGATPTAAPTEAPAAATENKASAPAGNTAKRK